MSVNYIRKSTREKLKSLKTHCRYCGKYDKELHIEHIHPRYYGGTCEEFNLTIACKRCNSSKGIFSIAEWYKSINTKRFDLYFKILYYLKCYRKFKKNGKLAFHSEKNLIKRILENKHLFTRYTSILNSLENNKYKL